MKYLLLISIFLTLSIHLNAQDKNVLIDLDYNIEYTAGLNWNTNGDILGGFNFKYSKRGKSNIFNTFLLEIVNVKHPKELKVIPDTSINNYTINKVNYLFVIRPQYGKEIVLFRKENGDGVQMNLIFAAGPSLAIIKPYLVFYGKNSNSYSSIPYNPQTMGSQSNIYGSAGIFEGLDKSKLRLGLNAKVSCLFEFGAFRNNLTGLELGFLAETFTKRITILANNENTNLFLSAFVNIYFGVRE